MACELAQKKLEPAMSSAQKANGLLFNKKKKIDNI
jgi:hypothetical protein